MKISIARLVLSAVFAFAFFSSAWAQTQAGQIKIARVEREVTKLMADGTTAALKNGDLVTEKDTVVTGKDSSVVLVFMNGSSVKLGAESKLAIEEFKMDPLAEDINMADFADRKKGEPSVSKTTLNLTYGEMVGDVKKLNTSSSYSIKTPVGAAGIRGTIYRIVYKPTSDGKAFFTVSTAEGLVVMTGITDVEIPIAENKEVVVEIDIPDVGDPAGTPTAAPKIITQDIPEETKSLITTASNSIASAAQETGFTPTPTTGTPTPTPTEPTPRSDGTPPADPTPPPPSLTPGAGST